MHRMEIKGKNEEKKIIINDNNDNNNNNRQTFLTKRKILLDDLGISPLISRNYQLTRNMPG